MYGVNPEQNEQSVDVTRQLTRAVRGGRLRIQADNSIAGDPALNVVKRLYIVYRVNGNRREATVDENALLDLPALADRGPEAKPEPPAPELALASDRAYRLRVAEPGRYEAVTASGRKLAATVRDLPAPVVISGAWELRFPPKWGAPDRVTLERLASWTANPDDGVKYFSGTATYTKEIDVPAWMLASGTSVLLDLGSVREVAEVKLNGKDLGILWKPPFRVDISGAVHAGSKSSGGTHHQPLAEPADRRRRAARREAPHLLDVPALPPRRPAARFRPPRPGDAGCGENHCAEIGSKARIWGRYGNFLSPDWEGRPPSVWSSPGRIAKAPPARVYPENVMVG